jgi:hypothetical protein
MIPEKQINDVFIEAYSDSRCQNQINTEQILKGNLTVGKSFPFPEIIDKSVESEHVLFEKKGNNVVITNYSKFGTYYKLKPLIPTKINYSQYIVIGNTWLLPENNQYEKKCILQLINKNYELFEKHFLPYGIPVKIGRGSKLNSIVISNIKISKCHLTLTPYENYVEVEDSNNCVIPPTPSFNGTWLYFNEATFQRYCLDLRIGQKTFLKVKKICDPNRTKIEEIDANERSLGEIK